MKDHVKVLVTFSACSIDRRLIKVFLTNFSNESGWFACNTFVHFIDSTSVDVTLLLGQSERSFSIRSFCDWLVNVFSANVIYQLWVPVRHIVEARKSARRCTLVEFYSKTRRKLTEKTSIKQILPINGGLTAGRALYR